MQYLDSNSILSEHQFGFRSSHSTSDQLIITYDDITKYIDQGLTVDLVFFDYSKAFDKVCHVVLLRKLSDIGVCHQILSWIQCFLTERKLHVKVSDSTSTERNVTSGVPQGSVLGPLLFLIYVNHVVFGLKCRFKIFADDIKLYLCFSSSDLQVVERVIQDDISALVSTSKSWGLVMNVSKCICLRFCPRSSTAPHEGISPYTIGDEPIKFSFSHSDLGVMIDRTLKFHNHVRRNANICNALTTNLFSSTLSREADFLMNIYRAHIRTKVQNQM